ncbi:MFS transporter [Campylobacter sp. MIT 12-8780]|uniref:MFS transporter n=1 Tax=unclassified Campylobacter TaxID=2593542 RepID=UPI00115C9AC2|nr:MULTISPECIES: MFS transporter [unclassified Campylobacter]NDJ27559.1 MFS transporter [Campylobacter sp. MIT 19-121]TQR41329.1 MFS transporter [Campylobacter sp. MIT 12-8780]
MNYIILLKNNKNVRILAFVQFIVYFGAWFSQTGVFTLLVDLNAPTWAVSISAMLAFLPGILLAPISGVIVEKSKPKTLLLLSASLELVSIFMLIFVTNLSMLWLLFILIFIRLCVATLYFQAEMSLMAKLLEPKELKLVNEIHSINWAVSYTLGMALAGFFISAFGVYSAFLFDCLLLAFGISLLLLLKIPQFQPAKAQKFISMIKDGFVYIFKNKLIFHLILLHAFIGLTAYETLVTLLAKHEYKEILSVALVIGFLNSVRACSLIIAPIILSSFTNKRTLKYLFFGQGSGILLWSFTQFDFYLSFIGLLAAGFCTSSIWSFTYTLIQEHCDKEYFGRVIAYTDMTYLSFSVFISLLSGLLFELSFSLMLITALLGGFFIFASFYWHWFYKRYLS